jgi:hypothetical protein
MSIGDPSRQPPGEEETAENLVRNSYWRDNAGKSILRECGTAPVPTQMNGNNGFSSVTVYIVWTNGAELAL